MQTSINKIKRLNVGCGPHHIRKDWWNVDIRAFRGVDQVMDITIPWPFEDLDLVYAEHFLEHLEPRGAIEFLTNALSALKVGGRIRLSTPSLEWVLRTHYTFDADVETQRRQTFQTNRAFHGWGHKFLYSRALLEWLFQGVGFSNVEFFDYGDSNTQEFVGIEQHGNFSRVGTFPSVWVIEGERTESSSSDLQTVEDMFTENFIKFVEGGH